MPYKLYCIEYLTKQKQQKKNNLHKSIKPTKESALVIPSTRLNGSTTLRWPVAHTKGVPHYYDGLNPHREEQRKWLSTSLETKPK